MSYEQTSKSPFHAVILEAEKRPIRQTKLEIIDNTPLSPLALPTLGTPGAMTVFIGRKGSGALDDVREAVRTGDKELEKLKKRFQGPAESFANSEELAQRMIDSSVFADIRYGNEVLNKGIFVPAGMDLAIAVFPYNGGRLLQDGFTLVEHYQQGSELEYEGLVVRVAPPLTEAEAAALAKVPADQDVMNVAHASWCDTTWWDIAYVAVSVTAAVLCVVVAPTSKDHLSEEVLAQLDPAASARELLALRRRLIRSSAKPEKSSQAAKNVVPALMADRPVEEKHLIRNR